MKRHFVWLNACFGGRNHKKPGAGSDPFLYPCLHQHNLPQTLNVQFTRMSQLLIFQTLLQQGAFSKSQRLTKALLLPFLLCFHGLLELPFLPGKQIAPLVQV